MTDEPILRGDEIIRELPLSEDGGELAIELRPVVVAHLQQAVLDAEGVVEVVVQLVLRELDVPIGEIATVEQLDPIRLGRAGHAGARRGEGAARASTSAR